jgi:hypothetical protein
LKAEGSSLETISAARIEAPQPRRLSSIFAELARDAQETVTIEQLRQALGDRSFAALLVFFSLINLLPLPPGSTLVLGLPLVLISIQMVFGRRTAWLPGFVLRKSVSAAQFRQMSDRFIPKLERLERLIRPRYWPLGHAHADRIIGAFALVLAIAVTLPIPLGNWFPAFSCALVGLALSERDGILLAAAVASGMLSLAVIGVVVGAASVVAAAIIH